MWYRINDQVRLAQTCLDICFSLLIRQARHWSYYFGHTSRTVRLNRRGLYKIDYLHNDQTYSHIISIPRGPSDLHILSLRNLNGYPSYDFAQQLDQFLGPKGDITNIASLNLRFCDLVDVDSDDKLEIVTNRGSAVVMGQDYVSFLDSD